MTLEAKGGGKPHESGRLMAAKLGLVLDCADPERLAAFWSEAIGYRTRARRAPT